MKLQGAIITWANFYLYLCLLLLVDPNRWNYILWNAHQSSQSFHPLLIFTLAQASSWLCHFLKRVNVFRLAGDWGVLYRRVSVLLVGLLNHNSGGRWEGYPVPTPWKVQVELDPYSSTIIWCIKWRKKEKKEPKREVTMALALHAKEATKSTGRVGKYIAHLSLLDILLKLQGTSWLSKVTQLYTQIFWLLDKSFSIFSLWNSRK